MKLAAILTNIRTQVIEFMNERFWLEELVLKFLLGKLKELKIIFAKHYSDCYSSKQAIIFQSKAASVFTRHYILLSISRGYNNAVFTGKIQPPQHLGKHDVTISGIQ